MSEKERENAGNKMKDVRNSICDVVVVVCTRLEAMRRERKCFVAGALLFLLMFFLTNEVSHTARFSSVSVNFRETRLGENKGEAFDEKEKRTCFAFFGNREDKGSDQRLGMWISWKLEHQTTSEKRTSAEKDPVFKKKMNLNHMET